VRVAGDQGGKEVGWGDWMDVVTLEERVEGIGRGCWFDSSFGFTGVTRGLVFKRSRWVGEGFWLLYF
jgi:hypothetical protein